MNNARSTCVTVTLLLAAVSLAFTGYSLVCSADCTSPGSHGTREDSAPETATGLDAQPSPTAVSDHASTLTTSEVEALDAQLRAMEQELESLAVLGEGGDAVIEGGLQ